MLCARSPRVTSADHWKIRNARTCIAIPSETKSNTTNNSRQLLLLVGSHLVLRSAPRRLCMQSWLCRTSTRMGQLLVYRSLQDSSATPGRLSQASHLERQGHVLQAAVFRWTSSRPRTCAGLSRLVLSSSTTLHVINSFTVGNTTNTLHRLSIHERRRSGMDWTLSRGFE